MEMDDSHLLVLDTQRRLLADWQRPDGHVRTPEDVAAFWAALGEPGLLGALAPEIAPQLKFISDIFLRLIRSIIAPLLFCVLVRAVGGSGGQGGLGRVGLKAFLFFEVATTLALVLGWMAAVLVRPGRHRPGGGEPRWWCRNDWFHSARARRCRWSGCR
mgnify:CR=1 FL=1